MSKKKKPKKLRITASKEELQGIGLTNSAESMMGKTFDIKDSKQVGTRVKYYIKPGFVYSNMVEIIEEWHK